MAARDSIGGSDIAEEQIQNEIIKFVEEKGLVSLMEIQQKYDGGKVKSRIPETVFYLIGQKKLAVAIFGGNIFSDKMIRIRKSDSEQERLIRIEEIRNALSEYEAHKNDAYAYYQSEIPAVGSFQGGAPKAVEFLLGEIDRLRKEMTELKQKRGGKR
jgi:hypothetical protein